MAKKTVQASSSNSSRPQSNSFYKFMAGFLLIISCLAITAYTSIHWVERQVLNTDNWVTLVAPVPKDPEVSKALGSYIADKIFTSVPVEQKVAEALPEQAAFLAPPLTSQLQKATTEASQKAVSSDAFQSVWIAANRVAMNRLLTNARDTTESSKTKSISIGNQEFTLNLNAGDGVVRQKLETVAPGLFSQQDSSSKISVAANLKAKRERVHQYIRGVDYLNAVLPVLIISTLLGALAFSSYRRRLITIFAGIVSVLALLQLIGMKALRPEILNQVQNTTYRPAVASVYDTMIATYRDNVINILIAAVILLIMGMLVGDNRLSRKLRDLLKLEKVTNSKYMGYWHSTRSFFKKQKYIVWLVIMGLVLTYLAFVADITPRSLTNSLFVFIGLIAAVQILANSPKQLKKS